MKTIFITGNHPRHVYIVKSFARYFKNFMWLIEKRQINIHHERLNNLSKTYKDHIDNFKYEENNELLSKQLRLKKCLTSHLLLVKKETLFKK